MPFQIHALPAETFAPFFALSDDDLRGHNIRNVIADGRPAYPCRVSLQDATEGERLLLLPHDHHRVNTPYRASGAIYVRETAQEALPLPGEVPGLLRRRILSARAYDAEGMMVWAEVVPGVEIEGAIERQFAMERTAYIHVHYAQPGCYACRVERV
jgi:hypothetical protein